VLVLFTTNRSYFILQIVEDVSGNSFIENTCAPQKDPNLEIREFERSVKQDKVLGIYEDEQPETLVPEPNTGIPASDPFTLEHLHGEVLQFNTNCHNCNSPCETNMKLTGILSNKQI
jgi:zinc finger protein